MNARIILTTCPDQTTAKSLARVLVENRLAACVNIAPGITSVYRWKGEIETGKEFLLVIKTTDKMLSKLESTLYAHHPYETPEFVVVTPEGVGQKYLGWIEESVGDKS